MTDLEQLLIAFTAIVVLSVLMFFTFNFFKRLHNMDWELREHKQEIKRLANNENPNRKAPRRPKPNVSPDYWKE